MHVDKAQEERRADESRQRVMLTIIRRMMHGAMAWGFGVWSSKVLQASHERETMGRVLMRMSNRALSAGLGAWKEAVEDGRTERAEEERRQHVMSKVEKRMTPIETSAIVIAHLPPRTPGATSKSTESGYIRHFFDTI